ncbi:MAG: VCBS repeat-containing protein [Caldilinea sp. CFX5]|nr:VCBS repeat-containing protein [Caldilinea sp. CFX5]
MNNNSLSIDNELLFMIAGGHIGLFMMKQWVTGIGVLLLIGLGFCLVRQPAAAQTVNNDAELVYLDANGFIRVFDPTTAANSANVQWVSPVGGWVDIAVGDFNGDGDSEIAAVKGVTGSGLLTIYDPVIATGAVVPNQLINGIPWRILYETPLEGAPYLVAAGDLDPNVAGAEIIYGARLNAEDNDESNDEVTLRALHATAPEGSNWALLAQHTISGSPWLQITVGNLDGVAPDEVVLVDKAGSLEVHRLSAPTFTRIVNWESKSQEWRAAAIANFFSFGLPGLVTSRSSSPGAASFWVFVYDEREDSLFRDAHHEFFLPAPEHFLVGDITGNGDEEVFFLRAVPTAVANIPRLVMRNRGADNPPAFEEALDTDSGYQGGVAADVDGDGRAEVIVMRNNKIRIYTQPEVNKALTETTPPVATNQRTILAGNLDRNGYLRTPTFSVTPAKLEGDLAAGEQSTQGALSLTNTGFGGALPFTLRIDGQPTWLRLSAIAGQTPATFNAAFDARLLAAGVYSTTIRISSSNSQVNNAPLALPVKLTVRAGLAPRAFDVILTPTNCAADATDEVVTLPIDGPAGMTFVARILAATATEGEDSAAEPMVSPASLDWPSAVPWVVAQSPNSAPTTMQLTFRPQRVTTSFVKATLELSAVDSRGTQTRRVPLGVLCTQTRLYLPVVAR